MCKSRKFIEREDDPTYGLSVLDHEEIAPYLNARVHMSDGDTYLTEGAARRLRVLWRTILFGESFPEVVEALKAKRYGG